MIVTSCGRCAKLIEEPARQPGGWTRSRCQSCQDLEDAAELLRSSADPEVLIYSHAAGAWWRSNGSGYTTIKHEAGRFTLRDAIKRIGSGFDWRCNQIPRPGPADCIVPVPLPDRYHKMSPSAFEAEYLCKPSYPREKGGRER